MLYVFKTQKQTRLPNANTLESDFAFSMTWGKKIENLH